MDGPLEQAVNVILPSGQKIMGLASSSRKRKEKNILCRTFNGVGRCVILCSKLQTTIMFCDQVKYRYDKISELMNGSPFFCVRMYTVKSTRCKLKQTYVSGRTYGVFVSFAWSLQFSSSSVSAWRFSAATVSDIVEKRGSLELPVTKTSFNLSRTDDPVSECYPGAKLPINNFNFWKTQGVSWISPSTCGVLTWNSIAWKNHHFSSFHTVGILYCNLLRVRILDFANAKLGW